MPCTLRSEPTRCAVQVLPWPVTNPIRLREAATSWSDHRPAIERYNRTVRHEWLDQYIINSIKEAQHFATQWLWTYNNDRPNMGIGGITPGQKLKTAA